ncbi:MAG: sensor histidine kinase [Candidatus Saccharibacteria bacterium]|nr:sensor histidine kinase [Rhodoferax sp.]
MAAGAYTVGAGKARDNAHAVSSRQLQLIALDLEATLERFETLPYALSFQSEAAQALHQPNNAALIARFNATLLDIQRQAKVAAVYLMDGNGITIATSNWDSTQDYTGKNFGFRPYFLDAMQGAAGRFYAIGSTTSEPGYFIAQPVYADLKRSTPIGVIAVKISLDGMAHAWKKIDDPVVLVDRWGVIFLSNRENWRYRSLVPLSADARADIARSQQYMGQAITAIGDLPGTARQEFADGEVQPAGRLGWQLILVPAQGPVVRAALLWAGVTLLLFAIALVSGWAIYQRKRRVEERTQAREALQLAADDLEWQIAKRTRELTVANQNIESKYRRLQETEHLLRNTQNELVQAGKLTMLGQMAAGVTHELNQPLTALRAFADNARVFLQRGNQDRVEENLVHISAASERMGTIISQLKGFARKSDDAVVAVDMGQSIRNSALLLDSDFKRSHTALEVAIGEPLQVTGDAVRIEQVLINLMRNAIDAVRGSAKQLVRVTLQRDGTGCLVQIRDSGPGIAHAAEAHLFEPFFSTKSSGDGMGLGLAISSSIVQALNGRLTARNHPEGGAEFSLWLPLAPAPDTP